MSVRFEVGDDLVGTVLLDRGAKLNALDLSVFEGLHAAAAQAEAAIAAGDCRAVLVRGAGRAFSAGLDVSLFGAQAAEGGAFDDARIAWLQQAFTWLEDLAVPTVAAVHGVALGGGCQLALACHLRVVAPDASIGLLEARWALLTDLGATWRLPRLVGLSRAIDLAISARQIDARTALAWGLADALLDGDDFGEQAQAYAARLAAGPTVALGAVPGLMRDSYRLDRAAVLTAERRAQQACLGSEDFAAVVRAAAAGQPPTFTGR